MEDHAKGDMMVPDAACVQRRPKWSKQQLCTSVLSLDLKLQRRGQLRGSTALPHKQDTCFWFLSLSFRWAGPKEFTERTLSLQELLQDHSGYLASISCNQK